MNNVSEQNKTTWLKNNTFTCKKLNARLSRSSCSLIRAENQDLKVKAGGAFQGRMITIPGICGRCSQVKSALQKKTERNFINRCLGREGNVEKSA